MYNTKELVGIKGELLSNIGKKSIVTETKEINIVTTREVWATLVAHIKVKYFRQSL